MKRDSRPVLAALLVLAITGCSDAPSPASPETRQPPSSGSLSVSTAITALGDPLDGLTSAQRARFDEGDEVFDRQFTEADGLGPLFNATSCAECHEDGPRGGIADNVETHVANLVGGSCDELEAHGGLVIQDHTTSLLRSYSGLSREPVPSQAQVVARRTTPMVFGFGLFEAIPDFEILALADPNDRNRDGISGRAHILSDGRLGRFGRKANGATLLDFNAGAFQNEMGITNPLGMTEPQLEGWPYGPTIDPTPEPELSSQDLAAATDYTRLLHAPPRGTITAEAAAGSVYFLATGCAGCHVPLMVTGSSPIRALSHRFVTPFSDFLLHDMGPGLADICRGNASPSEFRTEPLMGLHFRSRFLHDGRAATLEEAVRQHGGEATRSRDNFLRLKAGQRSALIAYLNTL